MTGRLNCDWKIRDCKYHYPCGQELAFGPDFPFPDHVESMLSYSEAKESCLERKHRGTEKVRSK